MPQVHIPGLDKPVSFPDNMTPEQIQAAIEQTVLPSIEQLKARRVKQGEYYGPNTRVENGAISAIPGPLERLGHGIMRGAQGLKQFGLELNNLVPVVPNPESKSPQNRSFTQAEAIAQENQRESLPQYTERLNTEESQYQAGRGTKPGLDLLSITGSGALTAPLAVVTGGATTIPQLAAQGALIGGGSALIQPTRSGKLGERAINTAIGTATGAVLNPAIVKTIQGLTSLVNTASGRVAGAISDDSVERIIRDAPGVSDLPKEAQRDLIKEAQEQIRRTGTLNAEQLARKANLLAQGATPTKSMITRDAADFTLERNLQKLSQSPDESLSRIGRELTDVYKTNDQAFGARLGKIGENLPQGTQEAHGMAVMKALDSLAEASQKDVSALYTKVRESVGDQLASDAKNLANTLDDLKDNTYAEKLVSSVTNKLRRFGMIDKEGNLTTNTLTVTQAEELRKFVNTLPNDFGKRDIIKAIDSDVLQGAGGDAFSTARTAASERFQTLANPATQRALNTLGELTQGKTAQQFIKQQIISGSEQDVQALMGSVAKIQAPEVRQSAIESLRSGVLQYLRDKAINPNSGQFSGAALSTALRDIGEGKLLRIFGAGKVKELQSLAQAAVDATYAPPYSAINASNTAPLLLSVTRGARAIPGIPLIVTQNAEKLAATAGYQGQLQNSLNAGLTTTTKGLLSNRARDALTSTAPVITFLGSQTAADALRQKARKKAK